MSHIKIEGYNQLRAVILGYLVHKVLKEADRPYDEGVLSGNKLNEILKRKTFKKRTKKDFSLY